MFRNNPARSVAAVLMLVWVLVVPASGELVFDVGVIPSPFSPNADGVFDSTAIYYSLEEEAAIVLSVADSFGTGLWTLWSGWEDAGPHSHWWDGWFGDSLGLDGEYRFLLKAIPQSGPTVDIGFPFIVDTVAPALDSFEALPSRFSPDGDGVGDSLMVSFSAGGSEPSDQVMVKVLDEDDETVSLVYSATGVQSAQLFWNGTDDAGAAVGDGPYYVLAEIRDAAGNSSGSGTLIDLDTAPPTIGVDYPDSITVFRVDSSVADVTGWAQDRAGVVAVEYSLDGEEWLDATLTRGSTVSWTASVACTSCVPDTLDSERHVLVRAHDGTPTADGEGHVNTPSTSVPIYEFDVVFDVAPPEHVSTTISGGHSAFNPGQTITLTSMWDEPGYDVEVDFSQIDSEFDPSEVVVTESAGNRYSIAYEISEDNSLVPVVSVPVVAIATDFFARSVQGSPVNITVLPESSEGPTGLAVSANSFAPLEGERVVISLGSYEGTTTIDIHNMTGTLVRTLEGQGVSSISWYGDNDSGDTVASGVYFLRIQTSGSEAVRKVAVIK